MSNLNSNKIFGAVLCALLTVMLTGFIADHVIISPELEKDAVEIEGAAADSHGSSAPAKPKLPDPIMALLADADLAKGAKLSKACAACHSFDKGGPTKQGPTLWNVVDIKKCSTDGFSYSDGLCSLGGTWDYDSMNKFLAKPKKFAPGTKMNFAGLKKAKDRAALIAWLRQQADNPAPLPTAEDIAAEQIAFAPPVEEAPIEDAAPTAEHH